MMRHRVVALLLVVLAAPVGAAEKPGHEVTPDDYSSLAWVLDLSASPDGKRVAYSLGTWEPSEDTRKSDLWVIDTDGSGKPTRLTFDRANDHNPKWSADGKWLYFLGKRQRGNEKKPPYDNTMQVWRVRADGGEPVAVTRVEGGVSAFDYASQADTLFFARDAHTDDDDDFRRLRERFDKVEYGRGKRKVSEVHRLDLGTWRAEKVVAEKRYVREMAVTRDGKRLAMVTAFDDSVVKSEGESRVDVWEGGRVVTPPTDVYRKDAASPYAWLQWLAWSADGDGLAFCAIFDAYPAEVIHIRHNGDGWKTERMPRPDDLQVQGYGSPLKWDGDRLLFLTERSGVTRLAEWRGSTVRVLGEGPVVVSAFDTPSAGNGIVLLAGGPERFPDLYAAGNGRKPVRLTNNHPQAAGWKLPSVRHITWKAPDGTQVGGVLELPYGHQAGKPLPLVVAIHGGPTTATKAELSFDPHNGRLYFSARGYAVLLPNYRGSTGYGDRFVTDLIGRENDVDVKDILAGVQHLIKEGVADPERVGVMGWSNGGYLTDCLITLKDPPVKLRAASSGAGIVDTVAEWGFNDEPAYPIVFKKGLPWEMPANYHKTSPTYGLGNVTTPTLIHVGGGDERCPPGHSRMLFRALNEYRKIPTELVVYPGEPHGLTKMSNRKAKMEWDLAWFEKYLKGAKGEPSSR